METLPESEKVKSNFRTIINSKAFYYLSRVLPVIAASITIYIFFFKPNQTPIPQHVLKIGFTPHFVSGGIETLEKVYDENIAISVNEYLTNKLGVDNVKVEIEIVPKRYKYIFDYLEEGKIDIAYVSPYTYLHELHKGKKINNFHIIGTKLNQGREIYFSYIVINKECEYITEIKDINSKNLDTNLFSITLGEQEYSTSTRIIPIIEFSKNGLVLNAYDFKTKSRPEMIHSVITSNNCEIGVIASEDWERLPQHEKDKLRIIKINTQIPFDPIIVNTKNWNQIDENIRNNVMNALKYGTNFANLGESWQYNIFESYVSSGIITTSLNSDSSEVLLPSSDYDLWDLNTKWQSKKRKVAIIDFKQELSSNGKYSTNKILIGYADFVKFEGINKGVIKNINYISNKRILKGLHVIPVDKLN